MNTKETRKFSSVIERPWRVAVRAWRVILLAFLVLVTQPTVLDLPRTVNVAAVDTRQFVDGASISVDGGLIAYQQAPYGASYVYVYDTVTDLYSSFAPPTLVSTDPIISGNKIVLASSTTGFDWGIYTCTLQSLVPLAPCGHWASIGNVDHGISPGPGTLVFRGDIVAWVRVRGFSYYRFSSGKVINVTTPVPSSVSGSTVSIALSTNGALIVFNARATLASPSYTVMYYSVTASSASLVDTGLPTTLGLISVSQDTIAFNDNSTTLANRVRYYNVPKKPS